MVLNWRDKAPGSYGTRYIFGIGDIGVISITGVLLTLYYTDMTGRGITLLSKGYEFTFIPKIMYLYVYKLCLYHVGGFVYTAHYCCLGHTY